MTLQDVVAKSKSEVDIRDARPGDAEAIAALLGELGYPSDGAAVRRRLGRIRSDASSRLFVAETDGDIAGLAGLQVLPLIEHDEVGCMLTAIVVAERYRRRGIGVELVATVEREARYRGCSRLVLGSAERRTDAHAFYEALGFETTGRRFVKAL
jgi:N-acetylglutamate synthase-like GNAT family acetyltransferase